MKKTWLIVTILTLIGLFFVTTQALASPGLSASNNGHAPSNTPGAKATEVAAGGTSQGIGNPNGKHVNFRGTIAVVTPTSLTLTLKDGSSVTFVLTTTTSIKVPTLGRTATVANLLVGMDVNVNAIKDNAGVMTARIVLVVPGKPTLTHRVGSVTDYKAGISISILAQDGNTYTFLLTSTTKILPLNLAGNLVVGAQVTIIAPRDVSGGTLTATGIVVHP